MRLRGSMASRRRLFRMWIWTPKGGILNHRIQEAAMARTDRPTSPGQENRRSGVPIAEGSPLTVELTDFLQSGVSIILGAVDSDGRPLAAVGLACRVDREGVVRVVVRQPATAPVLTAVAAGSAIATTFSRPATHRSIQLKAAAAQTVAMDEEDSAAVAAQSSAFRQELIGVDHDEVFASLFVAHDPAELVVLTFRPDRGFVQTPGPGAGAELASTPR